MIRKLDTEKRTTFLLSALKLFVAQGVQNTTTAQIAKEAGTAAGTLFLYFPTKQDLIHELILKVAREQSEQIHSLLRSTFNAREMFQTIWEGTIYWFLENMEAYQYVQQVRDSGIIAAAVVEESNKYFDFYYMAIQKGLDEGSIKPYPIEMFGSFLYHDIVATMNLVQWQQSPDQQAKAIRQGFDIYWDGIKRNKEDLDRGKGYEV